MRKSVPVEVAVDGVIKRLQIEIREKADLRRKLRLNEWIENDSLKPTMRVRKFPQFAPGFRSRLSNGTSDSGQIFFLVMKFPDSMMPPRKRAAVFDRRSTVRSFRFRRYLGCRSPLSSSFSQCQAHDTKRESHRGNTLVTRASITYDG